MAIFLKNILEMSMCQHCKNILNDVPETLSKKHCNIISIKFYSNLIIKTMYDLFFIQCP